MTEPNTETAIDPAATSDPVADKARQVLAGDADGAAAPQRRGPGRPPGAKNKTRKRDRSRSGRSSRPASAAADAIEREPAAPEVPPEPPSPAELRGLGKMFGALWRVVGSRLNRRPLSASEELELAEAAHPVMLKYGGGALDKWGAEIGLGITLWGLWESTAVDPDPQLPPDQDPDAIAGA